MVCAGGVLAGGSSLLLLLVQLVGSSCPDQPTLLNLDLERLTGVWNVVKECGDLMVGAQTRRAARCKHAVLSIPRPETGHDLLVKTLSYNSTSRTYDETLLNLRKMKTGRLDGKFHSSSSEIHRDGAQYLVVGTDYDNYAVVWLCYTDPEDADDLEYSAVLSRKKSLAEWYLTEAKKLLLRGSCRSVDQSLCPEYKNFGW